MSVDLEDPLGISINPTKDGFLSLSGLPWAPEEEVEGPHLAPVL